MRKYFKIGEISKLYHIGVDSLRYYEELGLIAPERSQGGYRLYSVGDIWRLNVIRELRELDFTMEQIGDYLRSHNVETTLDMLRQEEQTIREKTETLNRVRVNVEKRLEILRQARERPLEEIRLEVCGPRRYFSIPEGYSEECEMDVLIKRLLNIHEERFYVIGNNQIGTVISRRALEEQGKLNYQSVFLIDPQGEKCLSGGSYLTVTYRGAYTQSARWIRKLLDYCREKGLTPKGNILELLWIDIHTSSREEEHITELQILVEEG